MPDISLYSHLDWALECFINYVQWYNIGSNIIGNKVNFEFLGM